MKFTIVFLTAMTCLTTSFLEPPAASQQHQIWIASMIMVPCNFFLMMFLGYLGWRRTWLQRKRDVVTVVPGQGSGGRVVPAPDPVAVTRETVHALRVQIPGVIEQA